MEEHEFDHITFNMWCDTKQITGDIKKSVYHHIMATCTQERLNDREVWEKMYVEILDHIVKNIPRNITKGHRYA